MKKLLLMPGLLCLALAVHAAETNSLSLRQAEDLAIENHPRITAAELIALASRQVVRETRSAFFPTITANATLVGTTSENTRIAAGALNNPLILNREADGINLSQLITDFGRTANLTASSKLNAQAQEKGALATREQILLAVNSAFFAALQEQAVLQVAQQTVATRQLLFDQVNELAKNQMRSALDVSFAKVALEQSKVLLANAQNDLQAGFATLANVLGRRDATNYLLLDELLPATNSLDAELLVQTALQNRPDLAQSRYARDAAEKFARAEKDLNYPTLSAAGAAGVIPIHDSFLKANYAAGGLNLSFPIFDGLLFTAREKEAEYRAKAAGEDLRDAENNIIRDVRIAALNRDYAAQQLTLAAEVLASANESFDLAQARLNVGSSSIVELSQAELNQTQAQIDQARAKFDYQIRSAVLNYQLGVLK